MPKIFIESKDVSFTGDPAEHLYLVLRDDSGKDFVIRGGPENEGNLQNLGKITIQANIPLESSKDARGSSTLQERNSREILLGTRNVNDVWSLMVQQANNIGSSNTPYSLLGPNSNSVIASVLRTVGINPYFTLPIGKGTTSFPGITTELSINTNLVGSSINPNLISGGPGSDTITGGYSKLDTYLSPTNNFGQDMIISTDGKLIFGGQEIKGVATQVTNQPNTYILRMGNPYSPNIFTLTQSGNDLIIKVNDSGDIDNRRRLKQKENNKATRRKLQDSPSSSLTLKDYFVNNADGLAGRFGITLQKTPLVQYTFGTEGILDTAPNDIYPVSSIKITPLTNGNVAAVWRSNTGNLADGNLKTNLSGQIFNSSGAPIGSKFTIDDKYNSGDPSIISLENGKFAVAWNREVQSADFSVNEIYNVMQTFNADGSIYNGQIRFSSDPISFHPSLTYLGNNRILMMGDTQAASYSNIPIISKGVILDSSGNTITSLFNINEGMDSNIISATPIGNNKFVAISNVRVITSPTTADFYIYGQTFDFNGNALSAPFKVNQPLTINGDGASYKYTHQTHPAVTSFSNGDFVIAWQSDGVSASKSYGIAGQRYDKNCNPIGNNFFISANGAPNMYPSITTLGNSDKYIVTYSSQRYDSPNLYWDIKAQILDSNDQVVGQEFKINSIDGKEEQSQVIFSNNGNIITCWANIPNGQNTNTQNTVSMRVFASNEIANALGKKGDTITGTTRGDKLVDLGGSNIFGKGGADTYVIGRKAGAKSTINDFDPTQQKLDFSSFPEIKQRSDLAITDTQTSRQRRLLNAATMQGINTTISLPDNQTVTLLNTAAANITASNFILAPNISIPVVSSTPNIGNIVIGQTLTIDLNPYITSTTGNTLTWRIEDGNGNPHPWLSVDPYTGIATGVVQSYNTPAHVFATDPFGKTASINFPLNGISQSLVPSKSPNRIYNPFRSPSASPVRSSTTHSPNAPTSLMSPTSWFASSRPTLHTSLVPSASPNHNPNPGQSSVGMSVGEEAGLGAGLGLAALAMAAALYYKFRPKKHNGVQTQQESRDTGSQQLVPASEFTTTKAKRKPFSQFSSAANSNKKPEPGASSPERFVKRGDRGSNLG